MNILNNVWNSFSCFPKRPEKQIEKNATATEIANVLPTDQQVHSTPRQEPGLISVELHVPSDEEDGSTIVFERYADNDSNTVESEEKLTENEQRELAISEWINNTMKKVLPEENLRDSLELEKRQNK